MTRRLQKLSRAKARTAWLAWAAWGVLGTIFLFEDTLGGSGIFAWIFTAPFWAVFVAWPFLWVWLKTRKYPEWVEADDDITAETVKCRLVQKDGVRYVDKHEAEEKFGIALQCDVVKIPGGDENFAALECLRPFADKNEKLRAWLAVVDSIELV